MTHTNILKQVAEKGTLIGQCAAVWYSNRKTDKNGKIYVLECAEMCQHKWVRKLWGKQLVKSIRRYARNHRHKRNNNTIYKIVSAETIRDFRNKKAMKQEALAEAINITQGYMSKIENENLKLSLTLIERISFILNVPIEKIILE